MKKIFALCFSIALLFGCSADSNDASSGLKDGQGGSLAIFALAGDYLYTVDEATLNVFSLIDQAEPAKVNDIEVGWDIETLFAHDGYLYIGSQEGMYIYSLSNPENPQFVSSVQHMRSCDPVVSNGVYSYVTLHSNSGCGGDLNVLQIYNTSNPALPELVHQRNLVHPKGLGLYGHYLVVCDDKIKIFDVANAANPVMVKSIDKSCFDVIIKDDTMFAIGNGSLSRYLLNADNIVDVELQSEIVF